MTYVCSVRSREGLGQCVQGTYVSKIVTSKKDLRDRLVELSKEIIVHAHQASLTDSSDSL